eukprot:13842724-Alexandrium_andersonii.AAC.1
MPGEDGDSHTEPIFFATNGRVEVVARLPVPQPLTGQFIGQRAAVQPIRAWRSTKRDVRVVGAGSAPARPQWHSGRQHDLFGLCACVLVASATVYASNSFGGVT